MTAPAFAQSTGLDDLVGARAGQAEQGIQARGYRYIRGEKSDDRSYAYWWNADRRQCVTIATMDGRYASITPSPAPDCRQPVHGDDRHDLRFTPPPYPGSRITADLPRYCRGEAAQAFDRRPSEVTVNQPIRQSNGTIVQGWFADDKGTRFFNCHFDADGRFLNVN